MTMATIVYREEGWDDAPATKIAKAYGCKRVEGLPSSGELEAGVLYLTDHPDAWDRSVPQSVPVRCVSYAIAMEMVKIDEEGRA